VSCAQRVDEWVASLVFTQYTTTDKLLLIFGTTVWCEYVQLWNNHLAALEIF